MKEGAQSAAFALHDSLRDTGPCKALTCIKDPQKVEMCEASHLYREQLVQVALLLLRAGPEMISQGCEIIGASVLTLARIFTISLNVSRIKR